MCWSMYEKTEPTAKKRYPCDATIYYLSHYSERDFDSEDREIFSRIDKNSIIEIGEKYRKIKGIFDGEFTTFRARIEADYLCNKYDLYDEDAC